MIQKVKEGKSRQEGGNEEKLGDTEKGKEYGRKMQKTLWKKRNPVTVCSPIKEVFPPAKQQLLKITSLKHTSFGLCGNRAPSDGAEEPSKISGNAWALLL